MGDEWVRELERRWQGSQATNDELAWLRELIRSGRRVSEKQYSRLCEVGTALAADYLQIRESTGDLDRESLCLASYCGHAPARMVCRVDAPGGFVSWAEGLERWGCPALVRALLSVGDWLATDTKSRSTFDQLRTACLQYVEQPGPDAMARLREAESVVGNSENEFSLLSEYLRCPGIEALDSYGAMPFIVEGLVRSAECWGQERIRSLVSAGLVAWALSAVLSPTEGGEAGSSDLSHEQGR